MPDYILAIDQGTTSSRAIIFNSQGGLEASSQQEFKQYFPEDGWVEHDANEIFQSVLSCCEDALSQMGDKACQVKSIGISNQRETTVVWDKATGEPIYHAIVWQDRRTHQYCQELISQGYEASVQAKTGLLLDPYFSATKLAWLLDNIEGARDKAERGELAFGTIDSFLIYKLSGGKRHVTDASNASRTLLFNIHQQQWDDELLELFNIPKSLLPEVLDCTAEFAITDESILGHAMAIQGVAGDQQAALIGQGCFNAGAAKSTYGTGGFMMMNTGEKPLQSTHKLLTTIAYRINGQCHYALEGSIFIAGAAIQWLRDGLKLIQNAKDSELLASKIETNHGVILVPAFTGLGAPFWDADARGAILGITRDTGINEIVSAALQSTAYQSKDLQKAMEKDGQRPNLLRVDGGMAANDWAMQFLADILGADVTRPKVIETSALGAAYLAGLQAGIYSSLDEIAALWVGEKTFSPKMSKAERDAFYGKWQDAIERVKSH
jgi:glycerol kinase